MAIQKLNEKHMAMSIGIFGAVIQIIIAAIVLMGFGETLGMMFGFNFMSLVVPTFSLFEAVKLIILGFIGGALFGWLFAKIWNWTATQKWAK